MIKTINRFMLGAAIISATILPSCNSDHKPEGDDHDMAHDTTTAAEDTAQAVEEERVILPSPLQVATIFKRSGLKYYEGLTNPVSKASAYTSKFSKYLNMGVYSADLAYCVLNKQTQPALNYIKTLKQLGDGLGMSSVFESTSLVQRFEKNLSNEDSLAYILADLQMETDIYLEENDQKEVPAVMFAAAWVESVHLGAKVIEKDKSSKLGNRISEQINILDKIIKVLKQNESKDPAITDLIADLNSIKSTYDELPAVKEYMAKEAQEPTEEPIQLSADDLKKVTTKIEEVRNKIIKG